MQPLLETGMAADPIVQFLGWLAEARDADLFEYDAMTLATATPEGRPSARMVLLKGVDERGFAFFTNYESRKGRELTANPRAALVFFWNTLRRQVRIEGRVERVAPVESDAYFATRARGSQIAATASRQSAVLGNRNDLDERVAALEQEWEGQEVPRPPYWGGYRVVPESIEFWQNRRNRLHDRLIYRREGGNWTMERLSP